MLNFASFSKTPGRFGATVFPKLFERYGIDATYEALPATDPSEVLKTIYQAQLSGCAISQPLKQTIIPHLDCVSPLVAQTESCNTIVVSAGKLHGYNTDLAGAEFALKNEDLNCCLIYGTGGVVGSIVAALRNLHCSSIAILGRDTAKTAHITKKFGLMQFQEEQTYSLFVNCTPIGRDFLPDSLIKIITPCETIFDLNVSQQNNALAQYAIAAKKKIIPGYWMAIAQARDQFFYYTGIQVEIDEITQIVEQNYLTETMALTQKSAKG
jgi:shikimate 5-dehydrogenase